MKAKSITLLLISVVLVMLILCGCGEKAKYEAQLEEYNEKLSSLYSDKEDYQAIYDSAKSTYQQYSKYSGSPEWDAELERTKNIMIEAQEEIGSIERDIILYEIFRDNAETQLEKYK